MLRWRRPGRFLNSGYVKPLFQDIEAYDPKQDREKGIVRKA